jgi:hypothetical protein
VKESEKIVKMARLLAEWNIISPSAQNYESDRKAGFVCYELTKLFHGAFIREWNKLLKEQKVKR